MDIRRAFFRFYHMAQSTIAPSLEYSQTTYERVLFEFSACTGRWLDLGCGHQLLPPWRLHQEHCLTARAHLLIGLDYDETSLRTHKTIVNRTRAEISHLPFPADTFDLVTANMVVEHLSDPKSQLEEMFAVLKPGGFLVFHTPNSLGYGTLLARLIPNSLKVKLIWFLQERDEKDVFPTYYRLNSEKAIRSLAYRTGFEVSRLSMITSSAQLVMIPPLMILELLAIRLLMTRIARRFRTNIIAVLRKPRPVCEDGDLARPKTSEV
jgi:SAM-dependent methyltransferase